MHTMTTSYQLWASQGFVYASRTFSCETLRSRKKRMQNVKFSSKVIPEKKIQECNVPGIRNKSESLTVILPFAHTHTHTHFTSSLSLLVEHSPSSSSSSSSSYSLNWNLNRSSNLNHILTEKVIPQVRTFLISVRSKFVNCYSHTIPSIMQMNYPLIKKIMITYIQVRQTLYQTKIFPIAYSSLYFSKDQRQQIFLEPRSRKKVSKSDHQYFLIDLTW